MKKIYFLLIALLLVMLTACSRNSGLNNTKADTTSSMEYYYSLEDIMRRSTNIIKGTLTSIKDFSGTNNSTGFYCFDIDEDYTGNTPDEIYMENNKILIHDDDNNAYIVGHTYYLFLCAGESALHPHTIYHPVVKNLIIDADDAAVKTHVINNNLVITTNNISEQIKDLFA